MEIYYVLTLAEGTIYGPMSFKKAMLYKESIPIPTIIVKTVVNQWGALVNG